MPIPFFMGKDANLIVLYPRLGYGNGRNGKAKTPDGMYLSLQGLSQLARQIPTITEPIDMVVLVQGFDRDCMSDLLTNLFHNILHQYTKGPL